MTDDRCSDHAVRALLGLYALSRLADADDAAVRCHLDDCAGCRAELAELTAVTAALDLLTPADIAEILVADLPVDETEPAVPEIRVPCRFALPQRYARGVSGPPVRRPGKGLRPASQLPPGRPGER